MAKLATLDEKLNQLAELLPSQTNQDMITSIHTALASFREGMNGYKDAAEQLLSIDKDRRAAGLPPSQP